MFVSTEMGWVIGYLILPFLAYLTKSFRHLQLAISGAQIMWIFAINYIHESPRWQIAHGHLNEAKKIIEKAAQMNSNRNDQETDKQIDHFLNQKESKNKFHVKSKLCDLFKARLYVKYMLILYFVWFSITFTYYGVLYNVGQLSGNIYTNSLVYAFAELLSKAFLLVVFKRVSRIKLQFALLFAAGLSCLSLIAFLKYDNYYITITIAMIGKFANTTSFTVIYLQTVEIMPTVIRQTGVGSCSVFGRVGSIIAPFIKDLVCIAHKYSNKFKKNVILFLFLV